jgi:ArsR family transcriptional regulator
MLLIKAEQELCVCELSTALNDIQPKISRHLAQLRKNELLLDRRQGQWVFYRMNPNLPDWIVQTLDATLAENSSFVRKNVQRLQRMGDRPERISRCC